jgi:hypothetical protein
VRFPGVRIEETHNRVGGVAFDGIDMVKLARVGPMAFATGTPVIENSEVVTVEAPDLIGVGEVGMDAIGESEVLSIDTSRFLFGRQVLGQFR